MLEMVRGVAALGMEVCCTLGMLTESQAAAPEAKPASRAYNHNLDTSPEFYGEIITTRVYEDRLRTIASRAQSRHHRLLRRNHRHGRIRRGPHRPAAPTRQSRSASRKRADQHAGARCEGTPLGQRCGARSSDHGAHDRHRANADARLAGAPRRGPPADVAAKLSRCVFSPARIPFSSGEKLLTTPNPERDDDQKLLAIWACRRMQHG